MSVTHSLPVAVAGAGPAGCAAARRSGVPASRLSSMNVAGRARTSRAGTLIVPPQWHCWNTAASPWSLRRPGWSPLPSHGAAQHERPDMAAEARSGTGLDDSQSHHGPGTPRAHRGLRYSSVRYCGYSHLCRAGRQAACIRAPGRQQRDRALLRRRAGDRSSRTAGKGMGDCGGAAYGGFGQRLRFGRSRRPSAGQRRGRPAAVRVSRRLPSGLCLDLSAGQRPG